MKTNGLRVRAAIEKADWSDPIFQIVQEGAGYLFDYAEEKWSNTETS